jgi:hypothetical protein
VQSISSKRISCTNAATDPGTDYMPVGLSGLKITGGKFQFNWATNKLWAGTCRRLFVHLADGTTPYLDFQFN